MGLGEDVTGGEGSRIKRRSLEVDIDDDNGDDDGRGGVGDIPVCPGMDVLLLIGGSGDILKLEISLRGFLYGHLNTILEERGIRYLFHPPWLCMVSESQ